MAGLSDAHHFRRLVAGFCMVGSPLFLLAAAIVHPGSETDEAAQLAVIAGNLDAWYAAHVLALISIVLAVPAVLGLMHMLREREVTLGHIGAGLALLGLLAFTGLVAITGFAGWQMGAAGSSAEMGALLERINETAGVFVPFYAGSFLLALGMIALALGLYRAHAVQWWMALFVALAAVLVVIAGPVASNTVLVAGAAFLLVGLGSIGRVVLTESDEDWEHTPTYRGLGPTAGAH
jgi:hypothetical protein